jgi:hypothetical protein
MSAFHQDDSGWPIIHLRIVGKLSVPDFRMWMAQFVTVFARKQHFCLVMDLTASEVPSPEIASEAKNLVAPHRDLMRKYLLGTVFIVKSTAIRLALNAMLLIIRPPNPTRLVATQREADEHCRNILLAGASKVAAG